RTFLAAVEQAITIRSLLLQLIDQGGTTVERGAQRLSERGHARGSRNGRAQSLARKTPALGRRFVQDSDGQWVDIEMAGSPLVGLRFAPPNLRPAVDVSGRWPASRPGRR